MGLPRYMALARVDDPEQAAWLGDDMVAEPDKAGSVCLLQIARPSLQAARLGDELRKLGRRPVPLVVTSREQARSDAAVGRLAGSSAVWVFGDDLLETFFTVFATDVAFSLRARARAGLPVIGIGGGALALGGLLLAQRVCGEAQYDLVAGLGWAPRVMFDTGVDRPDFDSAIARAAVRSLPGLLSIDLGESGGIRVEGGRVESIGSEPIVLLGGGGADDSVLSLALDPGKNTTLAPPPFVPFERRLLPPATIKALAASAARPARQSAVTAPGALRQAPEPNDTLATDASAADITHAKPGSGRVCPMCKKVHGAEAQLELAA